MTRLFIAIAIGTSSLLEASQEHPFVTIENVRPYGYSGNERAIIADIRIHNYTETTFWFDGQSPDFPFYSVRNSMGEWRSAVLCGTGAGYHPLSPGKVLTFPLISSRDSLAVQVALGSTAESIRNLSISSRDLPIERSQMSFFWIDCRRYLPLAAIGVFVMFGTGFFAWRGAKIKRLNKGNLANKP